MTNRRAFTLIEMLVVLAILATLTTIAIRSVAGVQDQARFDSSQATLSNIRDAVLGTLTTPGGVVGFVGDLGRLPTSLDELLVRPNGVAEGSLAQFPGQPVHLAVGWRGPYLRLAPGSTSLVDAYGTPFTAVIDADHWSVIALGADHAPGGTTTYDADVSLDLFRRTDEGEGKPQLDLYTASGAGLVEAGEISLAGHRVAVLMYGPDPVDGALVASAATIEPASESSRTYRIHESTLPVAPTIGPRILRAYLVTDTGTDMTAAEVIAAAPWAAVSAPTPVILVHGANPPLPTLHLQNP